MSLLIKGHQLANKRKFLSERKPKYRDSMFLTNKIEITGNPLIPRMLPILIPACNFPYSVSVEPEHLLCKKGEF
jgi:hypothetical protein